MAEAEDDRLPEEFKKAPAKTLWAFTDIELGKEIGRGAFSVVYRGRLNGLDVAVKKMRHAQDKESEKYLQTELAILQ